MGLINPIVVAFKVFFQKLCKEKLDWDEKLPEKFQKEWQCLIKNLDGIDNLKFDRCYGIPNKKDIVSVELHGFSDASESAYGACIYISIRYKDGTYKTR